MQFPAQALHFFLVDTAVGAEDEPGSPLGASLKMIISNPY